MTPFSWLLVGHFVGDMILGQTDYEATHKATHWLPCITHAAKWTIVLGLFAVFAGWTGSGTFLWWLLAMGVLHAVIDRRWPVRLIIKAKEYIPLGRPSDKEPPAFLMMWVDQVLHLIQVAILAVALSSQI